jgi:hypothetical protein
MDTGDDRGVAAVLEEMRRAEKALNDLGYPVR